MMPVLDEVVLLNKSGLGGDVVVHAPINSKTPKKVPLPETDKSVRISLSVRDCTSVLIAVNIPTSPEHNARQTYEIAEIAHAQPPAIQAYLEHVEVEFSAAEITGHIRAANTKN